MPTMSKETSRGGNHRDGRRHARSREDCARHDLPGKVGPRCGSYRALTAGGAAWDRRLCRALLRGCLALRGPRVGIACQRLVGRRNSVRIVAVVLPLTVVPAGRPRRGRRRDPFGFDGYVAIACPATCATWAAATSMTRRRPMQAGAVAARVEVGTTRRAEHGGFQC